VVEARFPDVGSGWDDARYAALAEDLYRQFIDR
jgi:hypothetical protein